MFLVDTNIFLEILLKQDKKEECKEFLQVNAGNIYITDFSLHSIGIVCFRYGKDDLYRQFIKDVLPNVNLVTLPINQYPEVVDTRKNLNLDFDDSYQYTVAKESGLKIATMDNDFGKIEDIEIIFL